MSDKPYKKSPLQFDQVIVGPIKSVLIIFDSRLDEWHCLEVDTERIKFTPLEISVLTNDNLPQATGLRP